MSDEVQLMARVLWKAMSFGLLPIEHLSHDLRRHYEEAADFALEELIANKYVLAKTSDTKRLEKKQTAILLRRTERRRSRKQI